MAKTTTTTTKTPAKKATKKPVTMAELHKHQARIEKHVKSQDAMLIDLLHRLIAGQNTLMESDIDVISKLDNIERLLATPQDVTGSPDGIKVAIPEQGLEPGAYTDASKDVADALTAMGFKWWDEHRNFYNSVQFGMGHKMVNCYKSVINGTRYITPSAFLSRAAVTAKAIGLVAKEEEPWKPEVGELVVCECDDFPETCPRGTIGPVICLYPNGAIDMVGLNGASRHMYPKERRKPTPEEVAKYHADKEAAKPIGPYVTRVMCDGYEWRVICGMDQLKRYRIHRIEGEFEYCVSVQRHEFTVIDP